MQSLAHLMRIYERHHTKEKTKVTHFIGVPLIILALQIILSYLRISWLGEISCAFIAACLLIIYYLILDLSLALITACFLLTLTYFAQVISSSLTGFHSFTLALILFILGWSLQLIGHYHYEKNKPAFLHSLLQLFIAPIFLVAELVFSLGYRKDLQQKLKSE